MSGEPRILASFVQGTLEAIDSLDADLGLRVRGGLKPGLADEIENAWAAAWVPVTHDVELTATFFRLAGEERACRTMRKALSDTFHKPILHSVIDGAVRLFGLSPGKLLRWAPRVWSLLYRDVGEMRVEPGDERATIWLSGLPPEVSDDRDYLMGTASAISAVFDLTNVTGACQLAEHGGGRARFDLLWRSL